MRVIVQFIGMNNRAIVIAWGPLFDEKIMALVLVKWLYRPIHSSIRGYYNTKEHFYIVPSGCWFRLTSLYRSRPLFSFGIIF